MTEALGGEAIVGNSNDEGEVDPPDRFDRNSLSNANISVWH